MYNDILSHLPYKSSFLFVDNITLLTEDKVIGDYTLKEDAFFYEDHFPGNPVTPGVIVTEIMAQIGLVVLGIYLVGLSPGEFAVTPGNKWMPLLASTDVAFYKMVLPGEKVTVISTKQYFRFGKLKCRIEMHDAAGEPIAKGVFSGFVRPSGPGIAGAKQI
ncbi:MAG: hydroxymyristoyl-ACP dehydratase [Puia sp.]|nr:hydroxymyristoyl-ACP dehydratase [Puia sp.]